MRLNEIITESQNLEEGPLGNIGSAIGKAGGALARGAGAVAGGAMGLGRAFKKGYYNGKATVAGDKLPYAAAPGSEDPYAGARGDDTAPPTGAQGDQGGASKETSTLQSQYDDLSAKLKDVEAKLNASKQKDKAQPQSPQAAKPNPDEQPGSAGAQQAKPNPDEQPGSAGAQQQQARPQQGAQQQANPQPSAQPAPRKKKFDTSNATDVTPNPPKALSAPQAAAQEPAQEPAPMAALAPAPTGRAQGGGKVAGQQSQTPGAIAKRNARAAAKAGPAAPQGEPAAPAAKGKLKARPAAKASQADIDADRERLIQPQTDSIIRSGNSLAETFASKVEQHKRKMFESELATGKISIYRK